MAQPVPFTTPVPPPETDWSGNLRDVIDTQQQTVRFLLGQWNALLQQVGIAGGEFGEAVVVNNGAKIASGWWQTVIPNTAGTTIGTVPIGTATVNVLSGLFWSDGNVTVTFAGSITIARVAVMEATSA